MTKNYGKIWKVQRSTRQSINIKFKRTSSSLFNIYTQAIKRNSIKQVIRSSWDSEEKFFFFNINNYIKKLN